MLLVFAGAAARTPPTRIDEEDGCARGVIVVDAVVDATRGERMVDDDEDEEEEDDDNRAADGRR